MVDVKDEIHNFVHDLDRLLLGSECFDGDFASDKGNEISNIVRLQEAVDDRRELVEAGLLPPHYVGEGLEFW